MVASGLFALFPHFLLFTKQILTEALYMPLLVALLAALLLPDRPTDSRGQWILVGVLLGLVALVRREAIMPAGLIVGTVAYLRIQSNRRQLALPGALVVLAAGLTLSPWLIRNWGLLGAPVLSSSSGVNFLVGNNPAATGGYSPPPPEYAAQLVGLDEMARDRKAWELTLGWIRSNPGDFLRLLPRKLISLWGPAHNLVLDGTDLALAFFYLTGLIRMTRQREGWQVVAVLAVSLVLCVSLIGVAFVGQWRYRLAAYPGLLMLAAHGVPDSWMERVHRTLAFSNLKSALRIP